jgi:hypothetical protein
MKGCEDSSSFQAEKLSTNYLKGSFHTRVPFGNIPEGVFRVKIYLDFSGFFSR